MRVFDDLGDMGKSAERAAADIVIRHIERVRSGACGANDKLFHDLRAVMPQAVAEQVHTNYSKRTARSDDKAEALLLVEAGLAIYDAESVKQKFPSMFAAAKQKVKSIISGKPSAERTYAKVLADEPITSEDEDAVIFGDLLNDN